ncbi:hypothetical protein [Cognatishimia activa]|nr:hypothetical protein [Cognatishimia activa]
MKKPMYSKILVGLLLLWAGLALGGNLIAAPAKFQVQSLTLEDLLRVGRAQFSWLGYAEMALAAGAIVLSFLVKRMWYTLVAAVSLFGVQQLVLQPMLEARTDLILAGLPNGGDHYHIWFVAAEVAKFVLLIVAAWQVSSNQPQRQSFAAQAT